jgi:uncharacterized protein DUF4255/carboxypeptidase family protein
MLTDLHHSLRRLLYEEAQIPADAVDIRFDAPTREWVASLTRPTINFFLFDMQENTELRQTNVQTTRGNGYGERRMPPRRVDLRYMVSALTTVVEDEHLLLWRTMAALLKHSQFPTEVLPEALRSLEPPLAGKIGKQEDGPRLLDLWEALDTPPHPALTYVITTSVDLEIAVRTPLVLTRTARYTRAAGDDAPPETAIHIGGVVRDAQGRPVSGAKVVVAGRAGGYFTDEDGRFLLPGTPAGEVSLEVSAPDGGTRRVTVSVPAESYDLILE